MKRNVSLDEISDGRLYGENDMVKADCHGCRGCSLCCRGMGNSVILDPYDVYRLQAGLGKTLSCLLEEGAVELNVVDGIILPNLGKRSGVIFWTERVDAASTPAAPAYAACFRWAGFMRRAISSIFSRPGNVILDAAPR